MDNALECKDVKEAVNIFWQAAQTNIAIIPRLLKWEEIEELGSKMEQEEAWFYMNTRWETWKKSEMFIALSVFWSHAKVRHALGIPIIKKDIRFKNKNLNFNEISNDISNVLDGRTLRAKVVRSAANISLKNACIIRDVDKKWMKLPRDVNNDIVDFDYLSKCVLEFYSIENTSEGTLLKISEAFNDIKKSQNNIHKAVKKNRLQNYIRDDDL